MTTARIDRREFILSSALVTGAALLPRPGLVATGENSLAGGLVFTIRSKEWVTVAPKEYAKTTAAWPKPKWGA